MPNHAKILTAIGAAAIFIATAASGAEQQCGDVNDNGAVTTTDALAVLRNAVGQPIALSCPDFVRRVGNTADTQKDSLFGKDFLLGMPVTFEFFATVTHFGLIARESGTHVKIALYTDNAGVPDTLVVGSTATEVSVGSQEIPVVATPIAAGNYWIMAVYNEATLLATDEEASAGNLVQLRALPFASALPSTFGPSFGYDNNKINYWVKVFE